MSSISRFTGARRVLIAVLLVATIVAGAAPGAAQEIPDDPRNATETTEASATEISDQLGDLVIHDYSHRSGEMHITATWRGETPETVTLTEMIELDDAGSTQIAFKTVRLLPESETEIVVEARERSDGIAAVMLTTPQSVDNNEALVLQTGSSGSSIDYQNWGVALLVGVLATLATIVLAKRYHDWKSEESIWVVDL